MGNAENLISKDAYKLACVNTDTVWTPSGRLFNASSFISLGDPASLQFERTSSFSFSFYFKRSAVGVAQTLLSKIQDTSTLKGYQIGINSSNQLVVRLTNTITTDEIHATSVETIPDTLGHSVGVSYDGSSDVSGLIVTLDKRQVTLTTVANTLSATILNSGIVLIGV